MSDMGFEAISSRLAARYSRRTALGRGLTLITAAVAGTAMPTVMPVARADSRGGPRAPLALCPHSLPCLRGTSYSSTCWVQCGYTCCGTRAARICDCCARDPNTGISCTPSHNCDNNGCYVADTVLYGCTQQAC
jgi:hypothetical protein